MGLTNVHWRSVITYGLSRVETERTFVDPFQDGLIFRITFTHASEGISSIASLMSTRPSFHHEKYGLHRVGTLLEAFQHEIQIRCINSSNDTSGTRSTIKERSSHTN